MFSCFLQLPFLLRTNLTAKATNSIANGMNSIAKAMNLIANGTNSIAKSPNSIAKTCKRGFHCILLLTCQIKQVEEEEEATTKDVSHLLTELRKACNESGGKM